MSNPPDPYNRSFNFEDFQSINPNSPLPAQHLENELNNIEETLDATVSRLAEIQNADGSLKVGNALTQQATQTATTVATSVATQVATDYLDANFDANAASSASASALAASQSASQSANSAHLASLHANYAEQATLAAQGSATQSASYRNSAEDYADQANLSKIAAHGSAQSAAANAAEVGNVYNSALSLKNWVDSESFQFLHKREDMADAGAIMLFNGGEAQNTLIGKIFFGASVNADSSIEYLPPINGVYPGNFGPYSGPWWVDGHESPEDPHKIVMRDMMSCLVDTWTYFGPRASSWNGEAHNLKPFQDGINGQPNSALHFGPERIKGVNYTLDNFGVGLQKGSQPLTPKGYVDEADTLLSARIDLKANKSGDTFTGKVNMTPSVTTAPLNLGSQQSSPSTTVAGDIWIGANINYKSFDGTTKAVANTNTTNQFSQGQAISVNSASNALRINQTGTGPALVVEDSTSPDATPFIIDANGRVGIGGSPDATAALKVDDGGIKFGDGTTLTTANHNHTIAQVSGLQDAINDAKLQEYDNFKIYTTNDLVLSGNKIFKFNSFVGAAGYGPVTHPSYWTEILAQPDLSPYARLDGATFTGKVDFTSTDGAAGLNIGIGGTDTSATTAGDMWIATGGSALNYRDGLGAWRILASRNLSNTFTVPQIVSAPAGTTSAALRVTQLGTGHALVVEDSNNPDATPFVIDSNGRVGVGVTPDATAAIKVDAGGVKFNDGTTLITANHQHTKAQVQGLVVELDGKANLSGASFTGNIYATSSIVQASRFIGMPLNGRASVNIGTGGTASASNQGGDLWITSGGKNINYVDGEATTQVAAAWGTPNIFSTYQVISGGSSSSTPMLRINQTGTGPALLVEDSTTPDTSSFVVNASGNVGVGVASSHSGTEKLEVVGNVKADGFVSGTGPVFRVNGFQSHTGGNDTHELLVSINGSTYRIGMTFVSTP
jgi:hypothetical protein